ncbi:MAG: hypothetical protein HPY45_05480 [Anaerolineae bacterium]|nr:hypothetical protein [Anaerolineae bacterium]
MATDNDQRIERLVVQLQQSRKYHSLGLPAATIRALLEVELVRWHSEKQALKAVRQKLHNIVAPYLGDPHYPTALAALDRAFQSGDPLAIKETCGQILAAHVSTRERLPFAEAFYRQLFDVTGVPMVILDLACGLNPLMLPWMHLPAGVRYYAFDIHAPRVQLINHFLSRSGLPPLAEVRDVVLDPPPVEADVAFLFKEAHRLEQRLRGCNRPLWEALRVRWLLVSLPTSSMSGKRSLVDQHRRLVSTILRRLNWQVEEILFENEIVFCIQKT